MWAWLILLAVSLPVCAFAAFWMALGQRRRSKMLESRFAVLEARFQGIEAKLARLAQEPPHAGIAEDQLERDGEQPEPAASPELVREETGIEEVPPAPAVAPAQVGKPARGFEETLGTRWAVWVGGVALALGGMFLVRYSFEQGFFSPSARISAGALFSLALLAAGEWLRRREIALSIPGVPSAHVPGVLTAAGTSTAFATIYAAYAIYGMLPPATAFVLLGAVSVLTMVASALHGPALAAFGLVAAFGTPFLVTSSRPDFLALVIYLAFVVLASYGVARLRLWRWLALAGATGAILWTLPLLESPSRAMLPLMLHILLQTSLAGLFLVVDPHRGVPDLEQHPDRLANSVLLAFAVLGVLVTGSGYAVGRPTFAGGLAFVLLALAVRFPAASPSAVWAALVTTGTLLVWPIARDIAAEPYTVFPDARGGRSNPEALQAYLSFGLSLPILITGASLWRVAKTGALPFQSAAWLCAAATLAPLTALVAAYWRVAHLERSISFAIVAGLLSLAFVGVTAWLRRDERDDTIGLAVGATAAAALAALAAGLAFALEKGMLTVALALAALGTAWIADRVAIAALRFAVGGIALVVLGRILWSPDIVPGAAGDGLIVNWFLWGYGVPALAFYAASHILERTGRDRIVRLLESLSILFAALLAFFEIRHWVQQGDVFAARSGHLEMGLLATTGIAFSIIMVRIDARRPDIVYRVASLLFGAVSLLISGFGLGAVHNPLFVLEPVSGGAVINTLLPSYLLPALLAGALAWFARRSRPRWYVLSAAGLALGLHLLYSVLAIRRAFHGPMVNLVQATGQAELWSYSVALLLIGIMILAVGLVWNIRLARLVSAGYIVAAVFKVFFIDLSNLQGITRALSFIGLGVVLVGIGLAYQRLLTSRIRLAEG